MNVRVAGAGFLAAALDAAQCPPMAHSEIVFLGRSNVGKSAFINYILGRKLARSSATPGKTRLVHFFQTVWEIPPPNAGEPERLVLHFLDVPGFGYAKVSQDRRKNWEKSLWGVLQTRASLKVFVHLIDARHTGLALDAAVAQNLEKIAKKDQKIVRFYTKCDKLSAAQKTQLARTVGAEFCVSVTQRGGAGAVRAILLEALGHCNGFR